MQTAGKLDSNFTYTEFVKLAEFRSPEEKIAKIPNNYSEFSFLARLVSKVDV